MDNTAYKPRKYTLIRGTGELLSPEGDVLWRDPDFIENALIDEGEESVLNVFLLAAANPSKYLALINGGTTAPVETDTLAYLAGGAGAQESKVPGASGYNRQQVNSGDWAAPTLQGGDFKTSATEKTFGPASGASWTVTHVGLVTHATSQSAGGGKFLAFVAISASTTVAIGQSFKYTISIAAQ
jgi:hypothetical protein